MLRLRTYSQGNIKLQFLTFGADTQTTTYSISIDTAFSNFRPSTSTIYHNLVFNLRTEYWFEDGYIRSPAIDLYIFDLRYIRNERLRKTHSKIMYLLLGIYPHTQHN